MNITRRLPLILVWSVLVVLLLGIGRPVPGSPAAQNGMQISGKQRTVHMRIAGMTCPACAKGLEASLRKMAGIVKADVDYKAGQAMITFDTAKESPESLSRFIASCGYQVKETKLV